MARSITIEIEDEDYDRIAAALKAEGVDQKTINELFVKFCFDNGKDWVLGEKRYRSLTEQQIDWIETIYKVILKDERPSYKRLYNDFNLAPGQAQYIARVLSDKNQAEWRARDREELKTVMETKESKDSAEAYIKKGELVKTVTIEVSRRAARELTNITDELCITRKLRAPIPDGNFGDMRTIKIPAPTYMAVLEELK